MGSVLTKPEQSLAKNKEEISNEEQKKIGRICFVCFLFFSLKSPLSDAATNDEWECFVLRMI